MPEQSLSIPELWPEHYNVELILASNVPRLQFPYRTLPGNPFLLPYKAA